MLFLIGYCILGVPHSSSCPSPCLLFFGASGARKKPGGSLAFSFCCSRERAGRSGWRTLLFSNSISGKIVSTIGTRLYLQLFLLIEHFPRTCELARSALVFLPFRFFFWSRLESGGWFVIRGRGTGRLERLGDMVILATSVLEETKPPRVLTVHIAA